MDVDAKDPLLSVASFRDGVVVMGSGRGGKPREESLHGAALTIHQGRRARRGRKVEGLKAVIRVLAR
jgi:topoisomerase-4 subunit A